MKWARTAPPVPDARICRWCGVRRRALVTRFDYCQNGCQANDATTLIEAECIDCGRRFLTGRPLMQAGSCHACDETVLAAVRRAGNEGRIYYWSRYGQGGVRN